MAKGSPTDQRKGESVYMEIAIIADDMKKELMFTFLLLTKHLRGFY